MTTAKFQRDLYPFLTDGRTFLGPYTPGSIRAMARGRQHLQADNPGCDIWVITAADIAGARAAFRRGPAR